MTRRGRRIPSFCLVTLVLGGITEGAARVAIAYKSRLVKLLPAITSPLHEYQEPDPRHPAGWRLKAGFVQTFAEAMAVARREGGATAEATLGAKVTRGYIRPDDVFLRINSDGFRGPEIDRSHGHLRILTLGDSCTFGKIERFSYPRVVERELRRGGRADVEVVNGAVEGYSPKEALQQIDRYMALRPAVTTIYIGWGALYNEAHALDGPRNWTRLEGVRLFARTFAHLSAAVQDPKGQAQRATLAPKRPDLKAAELLRLADFVPAFMADIEELVRAMQSAGSRVVLVTLPGLYTLDSPPTEKALQIGNLPAFTNNPYVLAKMSERYNAELRSLADREHLPVIDLDRWSRTALTPREAHFMNAVHLDEEAQEMAGRYIADELAHLIAASK